MKLYLAITADEYELPIAVTDTPAEMAQLVGLTRGSLLSAISRGSICESRNAIIMRLEVEDEE